MPVPSPPMLLLLWARGRRAEHRGALRRPPRQPSPSIGCSARTRATTKPSRQSRTRLLQSQTVMLLAFSPMVPVAVGSRTTSASSPPAPPTCSSNELLCCRRRVCTWTSVCGSWRSSTIALPRSHAILRTMRHRRRLRCHRLCRRGEALSTIGSPACIRPRTWPSSSWPPAAIRKRTQSRPLADCASSTLQAAIGPSETRRRVRTVPARAGSPRPRSRRWPTCSPLGPAAARKCRTGPRG
mmetsp:Transcript_148204/g.476020  ORF Transcript_148204/g.476020 Transcript_148204/m.476020 type:complete len:240 (-) Transcript_148204:2669-3388(-)